MFRIREAGENFGLPTNSSGPDYQIRLLSYETHNLGKVFGSSKQSHHWKFEVRSPNLKSSGEVELS